MGIRIYQKPEGTPASNDLFIFESKQSGVYYDKKVKWSTLMGLISAINDLQYYYKKSETYTKTEVNQLIAAIPTFSIEVVQQLPTTDISTTTIYLTPKQEAGTLDYYDEWINLDGTTSGWEWLGKTQVDLSNYYTKSETEAYVKGDGGAYIIQTKNDFVGLTTTAQTVIGALNEIKQTADGAASTATSAGQTATAAQGTADAAANAAAAAQLTANGKSTVSVTESQATGDTLATITVDGTPYVVRQKPADSALDSASTNAIQNGAVTDALATKADQTGTYAGFTSGKAQTVEVPVPTIAGTKTNPYIRRQIPYNTAEAETMQIVGATVNANQLVQNGNFADTSNWQSGGTLTVSDNTARVTLSANWNQHLAQNIGIVSGHKYYIRFNALVSSGFEDTLTLQSVLESTETNIKANLPITTTMTQYGFIFSAPQNGTILRLTKTNSASGHGGEYFEIRSFNLFDLSEYFGSNEIPDKVVAMEQTESGSGIAWLKSQGFFNEDYIGYRVNGLSSVQVSEKINYGKNLINWNVGKFSGGTGLVVTLPKGTYTLSQSVDVNTGNWYIKAQKSDSTYCSKDDLGLSTWYASSTTGVYYGANNAHYITFTIPENGVEIQVGTQTNPATDTPAQLEYGATRTAYQPYTETHIPFDTTKTLRGIYTLDGDSIKANGDVYNADGTIMRNYAEVDLGTLVWVYDSEYNYFSCQTDIGREKYPADNTTVPNFLCSKYLAGTNAKNNASAAAKDDKTIFARGGDYQIIYIKDSTYTDNTEFISSLNGVKLFYKKATPTTESATPFVANQSIDSNGTEEFTDYGVESGSRDFAVPPGNESNYYAYTDGSMTIPAIPPADGDYEMKLHVSGGVRTFTWE